MTARRSLPTKADIKRLAAGLVAGGLAGGAGRVELEILGVRAVFTSVDLSASESEAEALERKMRRAFGE